MNILSADTSSGILALEFSSASARIYSVKDIGLRHSEKLMDGIRDILAEAGMRPSDLDLFACTGGPGSFTGLRISMSAVKGLAAGTGKPFVSVPTLDYLAYGLEFYPGTVVPVIDARKGRVYTACYENGVKTTDDLDLTFDAVRELLSGKRSVLFTGPYADTAHAECGAAVRSAIHPLYFRGNPGALSVLAEQIFASSGASQSDASPLYIRKSEAEIHHDDRS